ncbi:anti-sigma factor family protein [Spelaeicoccus albus]|uniref:Anti-sigma factor RsiW n=1 Tax=Spelaeicoccus albus TaxID=1280376 RepID=A0A7Z0D3A3_9MICO|nr:zf-HC2 domain-containing protein [Spelaeicoccus albus]NYI68085.1 anti-sigma factor RsiW [Spelaeicoccus albus]
MSHLGKNLLMGCADGELSDEEYERVQAHVAECTRCQHELVALRQTSSKLRLLDDPELPSELTAKLLALGMSSSGSWLTPPQSDGPGVGPIPAEPVFSRRHGLGGQGSAGDGADPGLV